MKKLLRLLADYKKECILGPLFKMLEATFELFVPLVVKSMIDRGIGGSFFLRSARTPDLAQLRLNRFRALSRDSFSLT